MTTRFATSSTSAIRPSRDRRRRELVGLLVRQLHVARHRLHQAGPALGPHRPGIDRAEADVVLAVLAGERLGQVLAGGVGGARRDLPIGRLDAVVADQVDDAAAALLDHDRQHVAQAAHIAHELELQRLRPVLLGEMLDHAARRGAGIVDHDVDAAERLVALLDEVLGVGVLGEIGDDRRRSCGWSPWRSRPPPARAAPCGGRRWRHRRLPSPVSARCPCRCPRCRRSPAQSCL